MLNDKFKHQHVKFNKRNTLVIASSVSNGGGASVLAVEQDHEGLIDGVAVGEPNVNPKFKQQVLDQAGRRAGILRAQQAADGLHHAGQRVSGMRQRSRRRTPSPGSIWRRARRAAPASRPRGCSPRRRSPIRRTRRRRSSTTTASCPSRTWCSRATGSPTCRKSISVTYANTYGRFSVLDNLCSYSFAANAGVPGGPPVALAAAERGADLRHQQRHSADLGPRADQQRGSRADRRRIAARRRIKISTARFACARSPRPRTP